MGGERKRGGWSTYELERLQVLYPRSREADVARLLRRSVDSVRRKAVELFKRPVADRPWSASEDHRLRLAHGVLELEMVSLVLARSTADVRQRIAHLKEQQRSGAWSSRELRLLKQLYSSRSDLDLTVCLSRSLVEIQQQARLLCLAKDKRHATDAAPHGGERRMPRWTGAEVAKLRELYPTAENLEVAQALGRSVVSVANKASQLGLKKSGDLRAEVGRRNVLIRHRRSSDRTDD